MRTTTKAFGQLQRTDEGEWLHLLLAEIQLEIAEQPGPGAVDRIRGRVLGALTRPDSQAA